MFKIFKMKKTIIGDWMEHVMAVIIFIGILIAMGTLWDSFHVLWEHRNETDAFLEFLGSVFGVVIGIEFFKLLCDPGKDTLLEVLMFVIARHMIIDYTTTIENLLSVAAIAILFLIDKFLLNKESRHFQLEDNEE